jgi:hypothetical protein
MKTSFLVQRLEKPSVVADAFAFGGGLRNGGLSEDAAKLLRGIFSFDYMGAAEFEFGAVPKALQAIANCETLIAFPLRWPLSKVAPHWKLRRTPEAKAPPKALAELFVIAPAEWRDEVVARIKQWASEEYNGSLKESTYLNTALRPLEDWDSRRIGWLELDNGFFFFKERAAFEATAKLFGVEIEESAEAVA